MIGPQTGGRIGPQAAERISSAVASFEDSYRARRLAAATRCQIAPPQGHWPEFGDGSGGKTVLEADASMLSVRIGA
jgi:hypothetical protein